MLYFGQTISMWSFTEAVPAVSAVHAAAHQGAVAPVPLAENAQRETAKLYMERAAELQHYAYALTRNEELARDALQEAFMRYFVALCEGKRIGSPRAWLYRVTHNYLQDRRKEYRTRHEQSIECTPVCSDRHQDVERTCQHRELLDIVRATLTRREFECFQLRVEGLEYAEIAGLLRLSSGTVGALISRAVRRIQRVVRGDGGLR